MEIVLKNVTYNKFIKNVDMEIKKGVTGIIGESGSGKTLLLKIISKNLEPSSGTIDLNESIGYIDCQEQLITDITVYDLLASILKIKNYRIFEMDKRIKDVIIMVDLNIDLNRKVNTLSSSEQILLNIASVLIYNPKILLFDEPFDKLDEHHIKKILHIIRMLKNRYHKTIVIATNNVDVLHKISNYIYVLHKGKVVLEGDKYDVFKQTDKLKKYHVLSPNVVSFAQTVFELKNVKIGYRDEINDLIKDIYRYVK